MSIASALEELDALGLAELVRRRELTPLELCEAAITRIERDNPKLNCVVTRLYDEARRTAGEVGEGLLAGVPFLLKDLAADYAGAPSHEGSRWHRGRIADHDSELVARYRRAGLVVLGKTSSPEFGLMPVTEPVAFGPTDNPWKPGRTAGGSSGGAAAAVAARFVPAAHASDGGGSIRTPASCCGVFGLKPTRARTPVGPDASEGWHGLTVAHVVTRSVRDSAALLDAVHGPEPTSPYFAPPRVRPFLDEIATPPGRLRIAFSARPYLPTRGVQAPCLEALDSAARLCEELGHDVEERSFDVDPRELGRSFFVLVCASTAARLERDAHLLGRPPDKDELETSTWLTAMLGKRFSAFELSLALERLQAIARAAARFLADYDVILTPTLARPPLRHGELRARGIEGRLQELVAQRDLSFLLGAERMVDRAVGRIFDFMPFTPLANVAGLPSMSVPLHVDRDGLPIGVMFTGRFGDEATLFRLAAQLESARPWSSRRPALD
jgi:amidase